MHMYATKICAMKMNSVTRTALSNTITIHMQFRNWSLVDNRNTLKR